DDTARPIVSPSAISQTLSVIDDRIRTARTAAMSLFCFAAVALVAASLGRAVAPGFAATSAALAAVGGAGAVLATRVIGWQRTEVFDEIVLAGYRHVGGDGVARHIQELVNPGRRHMLAGTLERFLEVALGRHLAAVPLNRAGLCELEPHVRGLVTRVRNVDAVVDPAGMVLLRRLVTDGSTSPVFRVGGQPAELERAIELIHSQLGTMPVIQLRPAESTEPLRLAA